MKRTVPMINTIFLWILWTSMISAAVIFILVVLKQYAGVSDGILGFAGSIAGGIAGGGLTLYGVKLTIDNSDREKRRERFLDSYIERSKMAHEIIEDLKGILNYSTMTDNPLQSLDTLHNYRDRFSEVCTRIERESRDLRMIKTVRIYRRFFEGIELDKDKHKSLKAIAELVAMENDGDPDYTAYLNEMRPIAEKYKGYIQQTFKIVDDFSKRLDVQFEKFVE